MGEIRLNFCDLNKHEDMTDEFEFELSETPRGSQETDPGYLRDDILISRAKILGLDASRKIEQIYFYIGKRIVSADYKINQNSYMSTLFFSKEGIQPFINEVGSVRLRIGIQYQSHETCFYSGEIRLFSSRVNKNGIQNYWIQNVSSAKSMMAYLYDHDPYFESLPPDVQDDISHIHAYEQERDFYECVCMHIASYIRYSEANQSTCFRDQTRPENLISSYFNIASPETPMYVPCAENGIVYKFACAVISRIKQRVYELSCERFDDPDELDEVPESVLNSYYSGFSDCIYETFAEIKSSEVNQLYEILTSIQYLKTRLQSLPGAVAKIDTCDHIHAHPCDVSYAVIKNDIQRLIKESDSDNNRFYLPEISKDIFEHHVSLDAIYEYYCLGRIIQSIKSLGFIPDYFPLPTLHLYQNSLKNKLIIRNDGRETDPMVMHSDASIPNTYHYHSQDESISITVYYQPVIHTRTNYSVNGIDIYRLYAETDVNNVMMYIPMSAFDSQCPEKNQIFTPDFLIKRESEGKVTYGILDAKWSLPVDAYKGMPDVLNKYYKLVYTINDDTGCPQFGVPFLWLLAGKNYYSPKKNTSDSMEASDIFEVNPLRFKPRYGTGVLPLTPENDSAALDDLLRPFLFGE